MVDPRDMEFDQDDLEKVSDGYWDATRQRNAQARGEWVLRETESSSPGVAGTYTYLHLIEGRVIANMAKLGFTPKTAQGLMKRRAEQACGCPAGGWAEELRDYGFKTLLESELAPDSIGWWWLGHQQAARQTEGGREAAFAAVQAIKSSHDLMAALEQDEMAVVINISKIAREVAEFARSKQQ